MIVQAWGVGGSGGGADVEKGESGGGGVKLGRHNVGWWSNLKIRPSNHDFCLQNSFGQWHTLNLVGRKAIRTYPVFGLFIRVRRKIPLKRPHD